MTDRKVIPIREATPMKASEVRSMIILLMDARERKIASLTEIYTGILKRIYLDLWRARHGD